MSIRGWARGIGYARAQLDGCRICARARARRIRLQNAQIQLRRHAGGQSVHRRYARICAVAQHSASRFGMRVDVWSWSCGMCDVSWYVDDVADGDAGWMMRYVRRMPDTGAPSDTRIWVTVRMDTVRCRRSRMDTDSTDGSRARRRIPRKDSNARTVARPSPPVVAGGRVPDTDREARVGVAELGCARARRFARRWMVPDCQLSEIGVADTIQRLQLRVKLLDRFVGSWLLCWLRRSINLHRQSLQFK